MEVEVKLRSLARGQGHQITSHLYPSWIPCVCAPPQGADPCSNFKWLLRRRAGLS